MVAPAPGNTPTRKPNTEERAMVGAICPISSLFSFMLPNCPISICGSASRCSPFITVITTSVSAKVAIASSRKLIPSIKSILPKVKGVVPDVISVPTVAIIRPKTVINSALITCPLPEKAATAVRPRTMRAK